MSLLLVAGRYPGANHWLESNQCHEEKLDHDARGVQIPPADYSPPRKLSSSVENESLWTLNPKRHVGKTSNQCKN